MDLEFEQYFHVLRILIFKIAKIWGENSFMVFVESSQRQARIQCLCDKINEFDFQNKNCNKEEVNELSRNCRQLTTAIHPFDDACSSIVASNL